MNARITVTLNDETIKIISKIDKGNVSKYVSDCIKLRNKNGVLTDPILLYKELKTNRLLKQDFKNWLDRLNEIYERNK
jgi:hypothetical protein